MTDDVDDVGEGCEQQLQPRLQYHFQLHGNMQSIVIFRQNKYSQNFVLFVVSGILFC